MRLAVVPAAFMAVLAAALIVFVLLAQDGAADATTWAVLTGGAVLGGGVLGGAAFAARADARRVSRQYASLPRVVAAGQSDLQDVLQRLERGESVEQVPFTHQTPPATDPLGRLAYEISVAMWQARTVVAQTAQSSQSSQSVSPDTEEKVEVFVNLARRLQSLVHRAISMLDQLENEVEDPELLKGLFHVDHLATRIRRHAENVAVLGGSVSRRQWTRPVTLTEVLRSSIAEVEQYSRVKLVPPIEGTLRGHAVADVIHLLAELVENATSFSEPHTQVLLRAQRVTSGLAVEVEDRGLGMPLQEQARINALLAEPDHIDLSKLLADGRIGLYVVSALARRHGIAVRLQSNIYGGIQAVLVIPRGLLGEEPPAAPAQAALQAPAQAATGMSRPAQAPPGMSRPAQATADMSRSAQTATGIPQSAQAPAGMPRSAQTATGIPQSAQAPAGMPRSAQTATGIPQSAQAPAGMPQSAQTATGIPQSAQVASAQQSAMQASPARPTPPPPSSRQPLPPVNTAAAPMPPQQQHARGAGAAAPRDGESAYGGAPRDERPPLPQRNAQEHLVPELRNSPAPRRSADEEVEHDPGLMATFRRGFSLADHESDEPPTNSSR